MALSAPITYVELAASDLSATKTFYNKVFNWEFKDYSPEYVTFENAGIKGGFYHCDKSSNVNNGATLVVIHSGDLDACLKSVVQHGGTIKPNRSRSPVADAFTF